MNQKANRSAGFTIVELMLAMAFLAVLLVVITMTVIQISNVYNKGLTLRAVDQAGRTLQLGADRRYTGPDCPAEMLAEGGVPQCDCAPVPWLLSSRGYGILCRTDANGTCFDLAGERISVSTRAHAGPLVLDVLCAGTPPANLRALCRLTALEALHMYSNPPGHAGMQRAYPGVAGSYHHGQKLN